MSRSSSWLLILLCAGAVCAWFLVRSRGGGPSEGASGAARTEEARERFAPDRFHLERDLFLPANDPAVLPAEEATYLKPTDEVFGLVVGGHARAYPITMISYHHVVNDVIRGIPVAVTY